MLMNLSKTIVATIIAIGLVGCAQFNMNDIDTPLEKNWGRSFESAKYNQILDPESEENLDPIEGLAGSKAEHIVDSHIGCGEGNASKKNEN
ncbi:hypothetical protein DSCW_23660 [Desulfosarcina widdelii]|uniref:Lipoprotein n=1 Tax=Desulfosarcina widdelii TaxID=947919 RepID=A0A5K7Z3X3_9BACT|nr:hypothetical protein [Desulfosarcina widdelii]BBO74949.1 hypothetical protein DSCW_23660 [Desulfosarcina widdelii]